MTKPFRCPECRTRRVSFTAMLEHKRVSGHGLCGCGGYHYPHRKYSPLCTARPESGMISALRQGWEPSVGELIDAGVDALFNAPGRPLNRWPGE